jgi:hypothetical protein
MKAPDDLQPDAIARAAAAEKKRRQPYPEGTGVRRYPNGSSQPPPYRGLLNLEEVRRLDHAAYDLRALKTALPTAAHRRDAATALRAIERLLKADGETYR